MVGPNRTYGLAEIEEPNPWADPYWANRRLSIFSVMFSRVPMRWADRIRLRTTKPAVLLAAVLNWAVLAPPLDRLAYWRNMSNSLNADATRSANTGPAVGNLGQHPLRPDVQAGDRLHRREHRTGDPLDLLQLRRGRVRRYVDHRVLAARPRE